MKGLEVLLSIRDFWGTENESISLFNLKEFWRDSKGISEDLKEFIQFQNSSQGLSKYLRKLRKDPKLQFVKVFQGFRDLKNY